jgi:hypothetical protein
MRGLLIESPETKVTRNKPGRTRPLLAARERGRDWKNTKPTLHKLPDPNVTASVIDAFGAVALPQSISDLFRIRKSNVFLDPAK